VYAKTKGSHTLDFVQFLGPPSLREANCSVMNSKGSVFFTPSFGIHIAAESLSPKGAQKIAQSRDTHLGPVKSTGTPREEKGSDKWGKGRGSSGGTPPTPKKGEAPCRHRKKRISSGVNAYQLPQPRLPN